MESDNDEPEEFVQLQAVEVFKKWKLSSNGIDRLMQCGINTLRHLEVIDSKTISTIFAEECLLGDAILFRHMLRSWRELNKIDQLPSQPSQPFEFDECDSGGGGVDEYGNFSFVNFSLKKLMDQSISGRLVMKNHQNTNFLEKTDQNMVAAIIIDNHLKYSSHVSGRDFKRYSAEIKQLFPSENEDLYYKAPAPKSKSNPTGKLYARFKNMSAKYRKILPKPALNACPACPDDNVADEEESAVSSALQETSEIINEAVEWLLINAEPWEEVLEKWKITSLWRLNEIKNSSSRSVDEMLGVWIRYTDLQGYELIAIDFDTKFPGADALASEKFTALKGKLLPILQKSVKDKANKKLLKQLNDPQTNQDFQDCIMILLINAVVLPDRGPGKKKPTIRDAQNEMVVHVTKEEDIDEKVEELKQEGINHPMIIVAGADWGHLTTFQVIYKECTFSLASFKTCVEVIIKMKFLFSIEYNNKCRYAWEILEGFCYNLSTDRIFDPKVQDILGKLE